MPVEGNVPSARGSQRAGVLVAAALGAVVVALIAFSAGWMLGARRTVLTRTSPARDLVGIVMEGRCSQGMCEVLRIGENRRGGASKAVEALTPDERVDEIAWTPDGGRVGFVVNGYQFRVFDARTGQNLGAIDLIEPDGTPSSRIARGVTFSENGAAITFDDCPRDHSGCKPGLLALKLNRGSRQ